MLSLILYQARSSRKRFVKKQKAKEDGLLSNFDRYFLYNLADYSKPWNFDFTVNTEAQPYLPLTFINDYTYELGIDKDPSEDTDFTITFDPVIINQIV
jgi:hypothetical protein